MGKKKSQKKSPQSSPYTSSVNGDGATRSPSASPEISEKTPPEHLTDPDELRPLGGVQEKEEKLDPELFKEQGNAQFKAGNYLKASGLYTKAIEIRPSEPNYWNNRAAAYISLKRFASALSDAQAAASLQSSSPQTKTLLRLARCHLALGSVTGALSTLRTCLEIESSNATALSMTKNAKRLEEHLTTFRNSREKKEWGVARLALDRCFSECEGGGNEEWKKWRIEMEIIKGRWESASGLASDALMQSQQSPDLMYLRALLLFLTSRFPQAITHAQSALRFDPEHIPARKLLRRIRDVERLKEEGNSFFKSGQLKNAIDKYSECLDTIGEKEEEGYGGSLRATLLSNRATALLKMKQTKQALADVQASLVLSPGSFKALRTQARCQLELEDYEAAVQSFKSALESNAVSISADEDRGLKTELKKAEVLLKRSKTKDYYKILGLAKDCSDADIKKAYRRESLIHHPDKGGDEEKFKVVVEAHAVLSNPQRRERYDMGVDEDGQTDGSGMNGMGGMGMQDLSEIFAAMHGGGFGGFPGGHAHGGGHGPFGHSNPFGF